MNQMDPQKLAKLTGWLFLATFVTSIPARLLFVNGLGASWNDMRFIPGAGSDTAMYFGAILEFLLIVTSMGTAIFLYPIVKRQSEVGALGYVSARVVENAFILVGLISIISVVTVRENLVGASGAEAASLTAAGSTLVNTYEWAFLFGPGLVAGIGNGLILGYLMYRSGLIPPRLAMLGLIGGPLLIVGFVLVLFDVIEVGSGPQALTTAFEFVWELSFGIYLVVKGFRPSAVASLQARAPGARLDPALSAS